MTKITKRTAKDQAADDQDQLQALDESNTEWVKEWKRTVERKKKKPNDNSTLL